MADFYLTQTDAQVQSILNDAQDAMGAGAQTSLTTAYIMLKGTNGRYHKILKDSFTEAVRNVLANLLVNNDKGTTISQIPAIASGDFGSVTPANLASVLGEYTFGSSSTLITESTNFNTLNPGAYTVTNAVLQTMGNKPDYTANTRIRILVFAHFDNSLTSIFVFSNDLSISKICVGTKTSATGSVSWGYINITR